MTDYRQLMDLLETYKDCRTAVSYCEIILDQCDPKDKDQRTCFDILRAATPPVDSKTALEVIKECVDGESHCNAQQALAQMDHPMFLTYLRAKLGEV